MNENYKLKICSSGRFNKGLDTIKRQFREIDNVNDIIISEKRCKIFSFDVVLDNNIHASNFMEKLLLDKQRSIKVRKKHFKFINEKNFNYDLYFKMDPEILLIRPKKVNSFLKNYNKGYKYMKSNSKKSFESIKYALTLMPEDIRTIEIYNELEQRQC